METSIETTEQRLLRLEYQIDQLRKATLANMGPLTHRVSVIEHTIDKLVELVNKLLNLLANK